MNLIGKIFVFLIMFLSVVFMTMAMLVYATHKNWRAEVEGSTGPNKVVGWKQKYDDLTKQHEELKAQKDALKAQFDAERIAKERALSQLQTKLALVTKELDDKSVELAAKSTEASTLNEQGNKLADLNKSYAESESKTRAALVEAQKSSDNLFKSVVALSDKYHDLVAQIPSLQERAEQLARQVAKASLLLGTFGRTIEDPSDLLPPPMDGTITALSKRDDPNLVELSLGKDDGLRTNHRIDLYRGNAYLGNAVVTEISPDGRTAVAKIVDRKAPVREGDNFTTRLQYLTKNGK
ncbi:MAG: hypothetical protein SFX18_19615 [Pirellulales bacterium]|nr:hypothetical protein [Pirellulales bacterium]